MALTLQLITMEKTAEDDGPVPSFDDYEAYEQQLVKEPGHQDFAKKVLFLDPKNVRSSG